MTQLARFSNEVYALLRISAGAMFSFHGVQKIFGVLSDWQPELGSQLWIGGIIELVAGLLLVFGFQTADLGVYRQRHHGRSLLPVSLEVPIWT